ncbi:SDR family oxidoreductase [Roseovarius aestuarii]|nr:SDR family oxidoreductase [Roseovarius aestuarii]
MKRALVTGAGKRLGRAIAMELGAQGYDVAVHFATSSDAADSVVADLRKMGRQAVALCADLLDETQVEGLLPAAAAALGGPLNVLVNNASIYEKDTLQDATRQSWDRHFDSNLRAPFVLMQALAAQIPAPVCDTRGEPEAQGLVVNMIDQRVRKLTPECMSYTLAKSALWTLTQTGAQALAPQIRVNAIGPGPTLRSVHQSEADFANERAATLLERGANVSDITGALAYLLTAQAVTGQLICVDAGQHLGWRSAASTALDEC